MLSVEFKINGQLIAHLYGHNTGYKNLDSDIHSDICGYEWEYYEVNKGSKGVKEGIAQHSRNEGLAVLVEKILKKINK